MLFVVRRFSSLSWWTGMERVDGVVVVVVVVDDNDASVDAVDG